MDDNNNSDPVHNTGKVFSIAHLNLQSIKNKTDLVKLHVQKERFDIFSFSESWLSDHIPNNTLDIDGYSLIRSDRQWGIRNIHTRTMPKGGGGIGAFISQNIHYSTKELEKHNCSTEDMEVLWFRVICQISKDANIGIIYRPPQGNVQVFVDKLTEIVNDINIDNKSEIYVVGDFNINYLNNHANDTKKMKTFEHLTGLKQVIDQPTRYNNLLDLIYTNSDHVIKKGTADINISGHDLVFVKKKKRKEKYKVIDTLGRSYNNYNRAEFTRALQQEAWHDFYLSENINETWDIMLVKLSWWSMST